MIEGLKLRVTSSEIRAHCVKRRAYHEQQLAHKLRFLKELKGEYDRSKVNAEIAGHERSVAGFHFIAEHLFDDDYTLETCDIDRLEFVPRCNRDYVSDF